MNTYLNLANQALRIPFGLCLIHAHHTGWGGDRPRGGSTFQRNADFQFRLTKATPTAKLTETAVEMLCEKQKDEDSRWTIWLRFHVQELNATKRNGDPMTSLVAMPNDMAIHVALGRRWRGHEVKQGPVLLIVGEGQKGIERRVAAWARYHLGEDQLPGGTPLYRSVSPAGLDCKEAAEFLHSRAEEIAQAYIAN